MSEDTSVASGIDLMVGCRENGGGHRCYRRYSRSERFKKDKGDSPRSHGRLSVRSKLPITTP